jgi:hypothetical protein
MRLTQAHHSELKSLLHDTMAHELSTLQQRFNTMPTMDSDVAAVEA